MLLKFRLLVFAVFSIGLASPAFAQGLESLGSRAPALAAFVAVADDASAVVWNPAGMVLGPLFNISISLGRSSSVPDDPPLPDGQAGRLSSTLVAVGAPPMGLSYYRLATHVIDGPAAAAARADKMGKS